jgi:hypothetical protein
MRRLTFLLLLTTLIAAPALAAQTLASPVDTPPPSIAQATTPPATAPRPVQTAPPRAATPDPLGSRAAASTNVRLEMKISDTLTGQAVTKEVTMIVQSGSNGRIRTESFVAGKFRVNLNIDASTTAYLSGVVRTNVTFEYSPAPATAPSGDQPAQTPQLNESISVILLDGKPMIVSQSADPMTARKVTVELTATILK